MRTLIPLVSLALLAGCGKHPPKLGKLKDLLPEVSFEELKVKDIDFHGMETAFVFKVENPYPLGLELETLNWTLDLVGNDFLDGAKDKGIDIDPNAASKVRIPVGVKFVDVFKIAGDAKAAGEVPWNIKGDFSFKSPIGPLTIPVRAQGVMPALSAPKVSLQALRVGKLDLRTQTASLELDIGLSSDQAAPLTFSKFGYGIKLAGTEVASGDARIATIEDGEGTMTLPIDLKLLELGATIVDAVTKKSVLKVRLDADAEVDTPVGTIPLVVKEIRDLQLK